MVETTRKGIGYTLEAISAILILFIFVLGNTPTEPAQDWNKFRKDISAHDLSHVLQSTGDMENFMKRSNTGSLQTATDTLSEGRLSVSGNIEGLPIKRTNIGFNRSNGVNKVSLSSATTCSGDLEEIQSQAPILETDTTENGVRLYIGDTDPEVSGGNDGTVGDYDSIWVDNQSSCQFSLSEGPYYVDEIFNWADGSSRNHYDFKNVTDSNELILYRANTAVEISKELKRDLNGVKTSHEIDTVSIKDAELSDYDIIVFSREGSLDYADNNFDKLRTYLMNRGSIVLLSDLQSYHFDESDPSSSEFIVRSGLEWVSMSKSPLSSLSFEQNFNSQELNTYFNGLNGNIDSVSLDPGGKVASSNSDTVTGGEKLVVSDGSLYTRNEWNATNYSMEQRPPENFVGLPDTACISDPSTETQSFTYGEFDFPDYGDSGEKTYEVINTEMGDSASFCTTEDVRSIKIDLNRDSDFNDRDEGPYLNGEVLEVENKSYRVVFPNTQALRDGESLEFAFNGDLRQEAVNYRTSFRGFRGKMVRAGFSSDYTSEQEKMIASLIYWLEDDSKEFGNQKTGDITTKIIGSTRKNTYLPYTVSLRWQ